MYQRGGCFPFANQFISVLDVNCSLFTDLVIHINVFG